MTILRFEPSALVLGGGNEGWRFFGYARGEYPKVNIALMWSGEARRAFPGEILCGRARCGSTIFVLELAAVRVAASFYGRY